MPNPFFSSPSVPNPGIDMNQVKQIYNMLRSSSNPNELLNRMLAQNPQMAQAINLVRSNGNYEQVFRNMCQQRGINADEFIRSLNG